MFRDLKTKKKTGEEYTRTTCSFKNTHVIKRARYTGTSGEIMNKKLQKTIKISAIQKFYQFNKSDSMLLFITLKEVNISLP